MKPFSQKKPLKVAARGTKTIAMLETKKPISPSVASDGFLGLMLVPLAGQPCKRTGAATAFKMGGFLMVHIMIVLLTALFNTQVLIESLHGRRFFSCSQHILHVFLFCLSLYTLTCLLNKLPRARRLALSYFGILFVYYTGLAAMLLFYPRAVIGYGDGAIVAVNIPFFGGCISYIDKKAFYGFMMLCSLLSLLYFSLSQRVKLTYIKRLVEE